MDREITECDMCIENITCPAARIKDVHEINTHWYKIPNAECPKKICLGYSTRVETDNE